MWLDFRDELLHPCCVLHHKELLTVNSRFQNSYYNAKRPTPFRERSVFALSSTRGEAGLEGQPPHKAYRREDGKPRVEPVTDTTVGTEDIRKVFD